MSRCSTVCCAVSLVGCLLVLIVNLRGADRCMFILGIVECVCGGSLSLKQPFSFHLLLSYYYSLLNLLIHLVVVVSLLVLLILPQDPNNRSSAAQTFKDRVCASPWKTTSYNSPVGKVPEGSQQWICYCVCSLVYRYVIVSVAWYTGMLLCL